MSGCGGGDWFATTWGKEGDNWVHLVRHGDEIVMVVLLPYKDPCEALVLAGKYNEYS